MLPELFPDLLPEMLPEKLPEEKLPEKLPVTRVSRNFADVVNGSLNIQLHYAPGSGFGILVRGDEKQFSKIYQFLR